MRILGISFLTKKVPQRFPPPPGLDWSGHGRPHLQDRGGRAALVPARRSRPCVAPLRARARPHRRRRKRDPQDEVALRRAARTALARRADVAPGLGRAADRHGRRARPLPSRGARAAIPARRGPRRRGGHAAPLYGTGGERARVSGADTLSRSPRRPRAAHHPLVAGPARALLPAQAALGVRLSTAPDELLELRDRERSARRLLAAGRRRGVSRLRGRW